MTAEQRTEIALAWAGIESLIGMNERPVERQEPEWNVGVSALFMLRLQRDRLSKLMSEWERGANQ